MNKALALAIVVQLALLGFMAHRLLGLETQIAEIAQQQQTQAPETAGAQSAELSPVVVGQANPIGVPGNNLTLADVRNVVRQELQRHEPPGDRSQMPDTDAVADPVDATVDQQILADVVHQELDFYLDVGEITDAEMAALQVEMAHLHPAARTQALQRIIQAMNTGDLKARL